MLNTKYTTLAYLKTAYKEADRDRKKRDYDAMKKAKREAKANLGNAIHNAVVTGYITTLAR